MTHPTKAEALSDWLFAFASGKAESIMLCRAAEELRRLSAVEAERDALRADAERYRWLLDNYARGDGYHAIDKALNDGEACDQLSPAIDAAMKGTT